MRKGTLFAVAGCILTLSSAVQADCVGGARTLKQFKLVDPNTIVLLVDNSPRILIKTLSAINPSSRIVIVKNSFCDFEKGVLAVDGQPVDAAQVKGLH